MDSELDRTHDQFESAIERAEFEAYLDEWMADKYDGLDPDEVKGEELEDCLIEQHEDEVREDAESAYWEHRALMWESQHGMGAFD